MNLKRFAHYFVVKKRFCLCVLILVAGLTHSIVAQDTIKANKPDTLHNTTTKSYSFNSLISFSFASFINSPYDLKNLVSVQANCMASYHYSISKYNVLHTFKTDFGYHHFIDSTWNKSKDFWLLQSVLTRQSNKKIKWSHSIQLDSQYSPSFQASYNSDTQLVYIPVSRFLSPLTIDVGCGIDWTLWDVSHLNFSFVATKFVFRNSKYSNDQLLSDQFNYFPIGKNEFIGINFGCNFQININKKLSKDLDWVSFGSIFAGGLTNPFFTLDLDNRLSYKVFKFFKITLDHHVVFNRVQSPKFQSLQELIMGVGF